MSPQQLRLVILNPYEKITRKKISSDHAIRSTELSGKGMYLPVLRLF